MIPSRHLVLGLAVAVIACGASGGGEAGGGVTGPMPASRVAEPMTDDFGGSSLDPSWALLREDLLDISVSGGELHLVTNQYSVWFNAEAGAHIHKTISGNFKATTSVKARKASDPSSFVGPDFQFGGLMALNPASGPYNYVFVVVGDRGGYLAVETKSTVDSSSSVQGPFWGSGDAELRICRIGPQFFLYKRMIGETTWTEAASYTRTDLPEDLWVGPFAYSYTTSPDLRASFDQVSIAPAYTQADCTRDGGGSAVFVAGALPQVESGATAPAPDEPPRRPRETGEPTR